MKRGDEVFIRALEVRGVVVEVGPPHRIRYDAGKRGALVESLNDEDCEPCVCKPGDHHWNNGGMDPEYCLRCGMGFWRYAFTECG